MKKTWVVLLLAVAVIPVPKKKPLPKAPQPIEVKGNNILWGTGVVWGDALNILWGTEIGLPTRT